MAGKVAYSRGQATAKNVPWLSLIVPSHAKMILEELQKMKSESFIPTPLKGIVTLNEANQRYDAAIHWIEQHRHAVISNGPFYLDTYDPSAGIIYVKAFRDVSYPFRQGYWSVFENPKLAIINAIDTHKYLAPGEPLNVRINVTVGGKPSNDAVVDYFLSDTEGRVILNGKAEPLGSRTVMDSLSSTVVNTHPTDVRVNVDNGLDLTGNIAGISDSFSQKGIFVITLNSNDTLQLHKGPNSLKIFAYTEEAFRPDIRTIPLLVVAD
jgi:peptide/nickel transport system substrate-binding protein